MDFAAPYGWSCEYRKISLVMHVETQYVSLIITWADAIDSQPFTPLDVHECRSFQRHESDKLGLSASMLRGERVITPVGGRERSA